MIAVCSLEESVLASSRGTQVPANLVEFDLDSLLEYAHACSSSLKTKTKMIEKKADLEETSKAYFPIVRRNCVLMCVSPRTVDPRIISQYLPQTESLEKKECFRVVIEDFELKTSTLGEPLVTVLKKQRRLLKKGVLLSMHITDTQLDAEITSEIRFVSSKVKKCKPYFMVSGLSLVLDLSPSTNEVGVSLSYNIDMVVLFHRYFSSDITQSLDNIFRHKIKSLPFDDLVSYLKYEGLLKNNHLFYKIITDKTADMEAVTCPFDNPSLQTSLLPFQRKTVNWLLSREGVTYNHETHSCSYVPLASPELCRALSCPSSYPLPDLEIHKILTKLCFGWKRVLYQGDVCWYNNYTGNILLRLQAASFLKSYIDSTKSAEVPGCGLLSEEMGLGKTVEMTTLIQLHPRPPCEVGTKVSLQFKDGGDYRYVKRAKTTLIAAPESILRQWYSEICQICPTLLVTIYKGLGKYPELNDIPQYIAEFLQSYDVVLLNYSTLSRELDYANYSSRHKPTRGGKKRNSEELEHEHLFSQSQVTTADRNLQKAESYRAEFRLPEFNNQNDVALGQKKYERLVITTLADKIAKRDPKTIAHTQYYESPLMSCQWWRVVLDEVQMVSSGSTRAFATASLLPRFHSWGVSGTPSVLPAVLKFLRFLPFNYEIQKYCWRLLTSEESRNEDYAELWLTLAIRHTKDMVYEDIKLPPQQRILLTISLTDVEQDKYKEVMDSALANIGIDDVSPTIANEISISSSGYSHLRSCLIKLRQLCGNLQVGKLPKTYTIRGRNKTKLLINGVKELKTLDSVLADMIDSVEENINDCKKAVANNVLDICQLLEYVFYPTKVIQVLNMLLPEIEGLISKIFHRIASDKEKVKDLKAILLRNDALPRENAGDISDSEEENAIMGPPKGNSPNQLASMKMENANNQIEDAQIVDSLTKFQELKDRISSTQLKLRSWNLLQHKCFFLLASAYFQLHDPEFQQKIKDLKKMLTPANLVLKIIGNSKILLGITSSKLEPTEHDGLFRNPLNENDGCAYENAAERNKYLEKRYYELAEQCRKKILKHSINVVHNTTEKHIRSKALVSTEEWSNDGTKLFPKSTKKLFAAIPRIDLSKGTSLVSNIRCKQLLDQFQGLVEKLNLQADLINRKLGHLLTALTNPLTNDEKDADGEEFDQSVQDQEQASCLMLVLSQMLTDRTNAVMESKTIITEIERQQENDFKQQAQRGNDRSFLKDLQKSRLLSKPDTKVSMEECIEDSRVLQAEFKNAKSSNEKEVSLDFLLILQTIFENEKTSQVLLKKELNSSLNQVFNSRVEYFRQLQQISDSVKNDIFRFTRENMDVESVETIFHNLYRNLAISQSKLTKSIARSRYLKTLQPQENTDNDKRLDRDDAICIICQSHIIVGSLTFCGHRFCKDCLEEWLKRSTRCPVCKAPTDRNSVYGFTQYKKDLKAQDLDGGEEKTPARDFVPAGAVNLVYKQLDENTLKKVQCINLPNSYGSKVDLIVKQALYLRNQEPNVQIVIFSQWQDLLIILAFALEKVGISYVSAKDSRISSSRKKNSNPVEDFKNQSNIKTCFLLNAQAQSSGLTLINATHIFLCEPLINTSTELQAISRIHRIGQSRPTTVWMFAIENTVEESIVALGTNHRIDYLKANTKENSEKEKKDHKISNNTVLGDDELRAAESFALTLGASATKRNSDPSEYVEDEDLHNIYFGDRSKSASSSYLNLLK